MTIGNDTPRLHRVIPRFEAPMRTGLTMQQARERFDNGYSNLKPDSAERTICQILKANIFTYLNLVIAILTLCTMIFGTFTNLVFLPVIIINTVIGIIQELRSKRALAKLSFVTAQSAAVIRDGQRLVIPADNTVLDDIAIFSGDQQIYADAIVLSGECSVNEALVTGEADEITKRPGDTLLSGSFVVSGECIARLDKVGRDSFVAQLTLDAKKTKTKSKIGMVFTLKRYVQIVGIIIVPIGITMFVRQLTSRLSDPDFTNRIASLGNDPHTAAVTEAMDATVGALIGMIPDGLYLLVSVALTVSVLHLARRRTLVQDRGCVETLARVNVLCVDKTGTITEPKMEVKSIEFLCEDRFNADDIKGILADYAGNMPPENETMLAIKGYINAQPRRYASKTMSFSSRLKYGGVTFSENESYLLGAPERILQSKYYKFQSIVEAHSARGYRVLLLAHYGGKIDEPLDVNRLMPLSLILLSNKIRPAAPATFSFFEKQGVKIIVISGDNPMTVSQIAREAGIAGAERYIDAAELTTDRHIKRAVGEYVVFGRVTPDQKRRLVRALKAAGNTVAMTGDGINDVLAMKDADCSIAMASGSEVASQVSDIVLLDSDFSAMTTVVMEGRRVINNLERSAALFFTKNIFSFLFVVAATIPLGALFPLQASQLTPYNMLLIGLPSFVLAMEANKSLVRGKFLVNVFKNALPSGLTSFLGLVGMYFFTSGWDMPAEELSTARATMALIIIAFVGFMMLYKICVPLNALRTALIITLFVGFIIVFAIFSNIPAQIADDGTVTRYVVEAISGGSILLAIGMCACTVPIYIGLLFAFGNRNLFSNRSHGKNR